MKIKHIKRQGFSTVELLIYVTGLAVLGAVLSLMIVQFYGLYREITALPHADRIGLLTVDRITKEIRSADSINMLESQFGTTNGVLQLTSISEGASVEKRFYLDGGVITYQEDDEDPLALSSRNFNISNFTFIPVVTPVSEGIKFNLEIEFQTRNATETKSYTGFAIVRQSYE
jgi:hypothetical protein